MPATRARTSTSREPAVCPTYSNVTGSACGATVTTVTSGGGMPAPGPPLWPPLSGAPFEGLHAASARARPARKLARKTRSVIGSGGLLRRKRRAILSSLHRHRLHGGAVLARKQADQPVDAVVAHLLGESAAVGGGQADSSDPDIEDLPRRAGPLQVVFDRDRLGSRAPHLGADRYLGVPGLGAQRPELDDLVAVACERAGISAHQQRPEFPRQLLLLLGAGTPPVDPHRELSGVPEIEVRQDLRLDELGDFPGIARLDALVLPDCRDDLLRDALHQHVRGSFFRQGGRRHERREQGRNEQQREVHEWFLSMLNSAYMHDLPKKNQSRSDSARFRAAWSIAPSALPSFLRTSSTFFAPAAWRSRPSGVMAARRLRRSAASSTRRTSLSASRRSTSWVMLDRTHAQRAASSPSGTGSPASTSWVRAASLAPDSSTCAKASSSWLSTACAACISDHMTSSEAAGPRRRAARRLFIYE